MGRWLVMMMMAVLLANESRGDVAVTLHAAARIDAGAELRLRDIATVTGSAFIAELPIDADTQQPGRLTLTVDDILRTLDAHGVGRAAAVVRGDRCTVIVRGRESPTRAEAPPTPPEADPPAADGRTVGDHVRAAIERSLGVSGPSLRLHFDPDDADQLARPTTGLTVDVHATGLGRRTPVRATIYHADGSIEVMRVNVGVQVQREVARLTRPLPRHAEIEPDHLTISREWLAPDEPHIEPGVATGQRLRRPLAAGDRLTDASVEPPIVIERGDIVMVHVVSGSVVLRQESRALESGRVGQRIRLEPISGGRSFRGAVEGPGRAVIMTSHTRHLEDA